MDLGLRLEPEALLRMGSLRGKDLHMYKLVGALSEASCGFSREYEPQSEQQYGSELAVGKMEVLTLGCLQHPSCILVCKMGAWEHHPSNTYTLIFSSFTA